METLIIYINKKLSHTTTIIEWELIKSSHGIFIFQLNYYNEVHSTVLEDHFTNRTLGKTKILTKIIQGYTAETFCSLY